MESFSSIVNSYWEKVKGNYDIEEKEFSNVCMNVFTFIRESISTGKGKNIRIKYLGVFEVSKSRVKYSKLALAENLEKGVITQEHFNKRMEVLNKHD